MWVWIGGPFRLVDRPTPGKPVESFNVPKKRATELPRTDEERVGEVFYALDVLERGLRDLFGRQSSCGHDPLIQLRRLFASVSSGTGIYRRREEQASFIRSILSNTVVGIVLIDQKGIVLRFSPAAERIFGYSASEIVGENVSILMPAPYGAEHDAHIRQYLETGRSAIIGVGREVVGRRKDGTRVSLDLSVSQENLQGEIVFLGMLHQLAETRQSGEPQSADLAHLQSETQSLRAALQDAQSADRSKTIAFAQASHEIRSLLTVIMGYAQVLRTDRDLDNTPKLRIGAADAICRSSDHLHRVLDDILDVSKMAAGQFEIARTPCSPRTIVSDVARAMHHEAQRKRLRLHVEFTGPIPETIQTDSIRLRQVLVNLIGNALKFTDRGEIRLISGIDPGEHDHSVMFFDIVDTGIGLAPEQITGLFEPFAQAKHITGPIRSGTGLGLHISRQICRLLGGDLFIVNTAPGAGTTFRATISTGPLAGIPMIEAPLVDPISRPREPSPPSLGAVPIRCRILLAEDDPDSRSLISHLLRRAGADVTVAENGRRAADLALARMGRDNAIDVLLMDMEMPVMDGLEAVRLLRREKFDSPIIALTAHTSDSSSYQCIEAGCDAFVTKPVAWEDLFDTISRLAAKSTEVFAAS